MSATQNSSPKKKEKLYTKTMTPDTVALESQPNQRVYTTTK